MELENTTVMSVLVGLAGILAQIVFRETLASSVLGVVLSIILAVIILCCTYFTLDGLQRSSMAVRKREENRKREYDEKLFRLLNKKLSDQVKLEKGIYSLLAKGAKMDVPVSVPDDSGDKWENLVEDIDSSMLKAAKLIIKHTQKSQEESGRIQGQNAEEMLQAIRSVGNQLQMLNGEIQELADRAAAAQGGNASNVSDDFPAETQPAGNASGQEMDLEDVDVNRMMEELFHSDAAEKPEGSADDAASEPDGVELYAEPVSEGAPDNGETYPEAMPEEMADGVETGMEPVEAEDSGASPSGTSWEGETGGAVFDMEPMPETETGVEELVLESEPEADSKTSDAANILPDSVIEDVDNMTEEDLDSLLGGLLPEPEPLDEPEMEKAGGGLTALDMLLGKQKEDAQGGQDEKESAEPADDAAVQQDQPASSKAISQEIVPDGDEGQSEPDSETAQDSITKEEPEPKPEPASSDPGKMMSPDDIAALLASMDS